MATYITDKIEFGGNIYKLQDSDALPLVGGNVTGPVNFGDSVNIDQMTVGDLVVTGSGTVTNNLQVNTINGVTVGNNPAFTDTTTLSSMTGTLSVDKGGTGATSAADARTNLGLGTAALANTASTVNNNNNLPTNAAVQDYVAQNTGWIPFGQATSSDGTQFTATVDGITELKDGVCVLLKNSGITSKSPFTININNLGAKPVYNSMDKTALETTIFNASYTMLFIYDASYGGTEGNLGSWICYRGYNSNTNTIGEYAGSCIAGPFGMARYSLIMRTDEDHWESLVATSGTGTSKTKNTSGFLLDNPIVLYQNSSTVAGGSTAGQTACWYTSSFDTRYSTNGGQFSSAGKPFYLVGTITDGKFYLYTTWWANELPNLADGRYYIYIGQMYSKYQCTLAPEHPIYYYDKLKSKILQYTGDRNDYISIGGRNLIKDGDLQKTKTIGSGGTSGAFLQYELTDYGKTEVGIENNILTVSFDYEATGIMNENSVLYAQINGSMGQILYALQNVRTYLLQNPSGRYQKALKVSATQAAQDQDHKFIRVYMTGIPGEAVVKVKNVKLEHGNMATDFSIAPEVIQQNITDLQTSVDDLQTDVSNLQTSCQNSMEIVDNLQVGGRNLLLNTKNSILIASSTSVNFNYSLTDYAKDKNVFFIQNEIFTISFNYLVLNNSNSNATVSIKINNLDGVITDIGNKYENSISQIVSSSNNYKRTVKITQAQAQSLINQSIFTITFNNITSSSEIRIYNLKLEYGNIATDYLPAPEEIGWDSPILTQYQGTKTEYSGEEISLNILNKSHCFIENFKIARGRIPTGANAGNQISNSWQGMAVYGNYLIRAKVGGTAYIYDLSETNYNIDHEVPQVDFGSKRTSASTKFGINFSTSNHAGVLSFTDKRYEDQEFPLLLVSDGYGPSLASTDPNYGITGEGYCYIQRMGSSTGGGLLYFSHTVGVIQLNVPTSSSYYFFPWCQWHYYKGKLYSFGHRRRANCASKKFNKHVLTKWSPNIESLITTDTSLNANIPVTTFTTDHIENQWEIYYDEEFMQGCTFYDDKIFATFGHGSASFPNKLIIYSLVTAEAIAAIDLDKNSNIASLTMEGCAVYNNKLLLGYDGDSILHSITFTKNNLEEVANTLSEVTVNSAGLMSAEDKVKLDSIYNYTSYPPAGTYADYFWYGGGFVARDGKTIFFSIPLPGANVRNCSIQCVALTVRKDGNANSGSASYIASGVTQNSSGYSFEYVKTPVGINVIVTKSSAFNSSTNYAVAIQFEYNLTMS